MPNMQTLQQHGVACGLEGCHSPFCGRQKVSGEDANKIIDVMVDQQCEGACDVCFKITCIFNPSTDWEATSSYFAR